LIKKIKRRKLLLKRIKKMPNKRSNLNPEVIRSLSKSKLLPKTDYEQGRYTGNTNNRLGDVRNASPRSK
jgi:hypothetical protein